MKVTFEDFRKTIYCRNILKSYVTGKAKQSKKFVYPMLWSLNVN